MTDSYTAELRDYIDRAFTIEHNGRATSQMVRASVARDLPEHLVDYLVGKGLASEVGAYFRAKDADGLPRAPKVNDEGIHAQMFLLSLDEFTFVYDAYLIQAEANKMQAERVRDRCMVAHGVDLAGAKAVTA